MHIPVADAADAQGLDVHAAIRAGQVTGLSRAELKSISLGADPAQVVNAHRGMYNTATGRYTREGTTRRSVGGARIAARDAARLRGEDVTDRIFDNVTFSREESRRYAELLRGGVKNTRLTAAGGRQPVSSGLARPGRPTPEQIMRDATSDHDAVRHLINNGYIVDAKVVAQAKATARLATVDIDARIGIAARGEAAFRAVPRGLGPAGGVTAAQRVALRDYQSSFFTAINGQLRNQIELGPVVAKAVREIDGVMAASRLRGEVQVWRGIAHPQQLFRDMDMDRDLTGFAWQETAYTSTSALEKVARDFGVRDLGAAPVLMRIVAPIGTGAVRLGGLGDQAEVLLERGLVFRIARDRGLSPAGYRLIDVEVIGR